MEKVKISELKETIGIPNLEIIVSSILKCDDAKDDKLDLGQFVKCIPVIINLTTVKRIVDCISLFYNEDKAKIEQIRQIVSVSNSEEIPVKKIYTAVTTAELPRLSNEEKEWYNNETRKIKEIVQKHNVGNFSLTCRRIYKYMTKNYGVVWEQCTKEVREKYDTEPDAKISKIRCVIEDETLKSIFSSLVDDFLEDPAKFC